MTFKLFLRLHFVLSLIVTAISFATATFAAGQREFVVHTFAGSGSQGDRPMGNLVADSLGNLYGSTFEGGTSGGLGTVYELVRPVPPKTAWIETVLYSFSGAADGGEPEAGLLFDKAGNLYGTTNRGGVADAGTVFELIPPATPGEAWTESVLHSFQPLTGDAGFPETGLTWDHSGNLIGVTSAGGSNRRSSCGETAGRCFNFRRLQRRARRGQKRSFRISNSDRGLFREELRSSPRTAFSTVRPTEVA